MSKEEIVLELTKLAYNDAVRNAGHNGIFDAKSTVTDLYNHIFTNIKESEHDK